jgi:hypothetical protein
MKNLLQYVDEQTFITTEGDEGIVTTIEPGVANVKDIQEVFYNAPKEIPMFVVRFGYYGRYSVFGSAPALKAAPAPVFHVLSSVTMFDTVLYISQDFITYSINKYKKVNPVADKYFMTLTVDKELLDADFLADTWFREHGYVEGNLATMEFDQSCEIVFSDLMFNNGGCEIRVIGSSRPVVN